jgi:hypothetical protein
MRLSLSHLLAGMLHVHTHIDFAFNLPAPQNAKAERARGSSLQNIITHQRNPIECQKWPGPKIKNPLLIALITQMI